MISITQNQEECRIEIDGNANIIAKEGIIAVHAMYDFMRESNPVGAQMFRALLTEFVSDNTLFGRYREEMQRA